MWEYLTQLAFMGRNMVPTFGKVGGWSTPDDEQVWMWQHQYGCPIITRYVRIILASLFGRGGNLLPAFLTTSVVSTYLGSLR